MRNKSKEQIVDDVVWDIDLGFVIKNNDQLHITVHNVIGIFLRQLREAEQKESPNSPTWDALGELTHEVEKKFREE